VAVALHLVAGAVWRYKIELNVYTRVASSGAPMSDVPLKISYVDRIEVGATDAEGGSELRERLESVQISGEGQSEILLDTLRRTIERAAIMTHVRADGAVAPSRLEGSGDATVEAIVRQMALGARFSFLPHHPVAKGDAWTSEETPPVSVGGGRPGRLRSRARHRLAAVVPCGEGQCAVIESDIELSVLEGGDAALSGGGRGQSTITIDLADGRPSRSQGSREARFKGSRQGKPIQVVSRVSYSSEVLTR
jgi:hypothetical protein